VKKKKRNEATKKAFKEATSSLYANERTKPRSDETKVGARDICVAMNKKHHTGISCRTVEHLVQNGIVGVSPQIKGETGVVPPTIWNTLMVAFTSYVQIRQINGEGSYTNILLN